MKIILVSVVLSVFLLAFVHFVLKRIGKLILCFYLCWFILFLSFLIVSGNFLYASESFVNTTSLMFFVLLTLLPVLMYNIVFWYLKKRNLDKRNYYLPITLFLINVFSLLYFRVENGKDEFTYEVIENVMSYMNYIVILFVFPISTAFFSYQSFRILRVFPTPKVLKNDPLKFYLSLFVIFYILYIAIWVLQNYVLNEGSFKSILKGYYIFYFIASYYSIYVVYNFYSTKKEVVNKVNKFDSIEEKITKAMKESKIFLNSRLTVKQLAKELGSNEKYVSNIINQRYQMNFSNFVNDFRIKHATEILLDEKYKNFTIEAIGGLSGFSSKSAFNATFKKVNGITPSEYKIRNTL